MDFNPNTAPTEFLKNYGEFVIACQNEEYEKAEEILLKLRQEEVTEKEEMLLILGQDLLDERMELEDILEEYFEQINTASP